MESVDQGQAESQTNQSQSTDASQGSAPQGQQAHTPPSQQQYVPFASGKEKFVINGKEEEWDWETTKKYAQLNNAGYRALEEASKIKKSAEKAYRDMVAAAQKDPESFIRMFNQNYRPQANPPGQQEQANQDPRDLKIRELEEKLQPLMAKLEQDQNEAERAAYEKEKAEVVQKYPRLKSKAAQAFLESEYIKNLRALDEPLSLEDVAFAVDQELAKEMSETTNQRAANAQKNASRAPVSTSSAGEAGKKPMTLEDVKRLAGRIA